MRTCTNHCRCCGGHFTSLKAFDAHRPRFDSEGGCEWPEDAALVELTGSCTVGHPDTPRVAMGLYQHVNVSEARDYFQALEGAQTASGKLKTAVTAA